MIKVRLLLFASLRERLGMGEELLALPDTVNQVKHIREYLIGRGGAWSEAMSLEKRLQVAVNHRLATPYTVIKDGDEVAYFPPVTGG